MTKTNIPHAHILFILVVAVVIAVGTYAFAASNTVPATQAGAGSGAISGYTITSVVYGLNGTDPTKIDTVAFTIAPIAAGTVKIQLLAAGTWYSCTNTGGSISCDTTVGTQATVSPSNNLTVVSSS